MFWVWGIQNLFFNMRGALLGLLQRFSPEGETDGPFVVLAFVAVIAVAYLLGSINFALVISRTFYHDDVRRHGSGNAGTTNILRTYGRKAGALTFLGDGLKGVAAILFACLVFGGHVPLTVTGAYLAAFVTVLGHVFPCFSRFHGGKGFATTATCILALNPVIFVILACVFFPLVLGSKYVSLGSVVSVLLYPVFLGALDPIFTQYGVSTLFAFLIAALVTWCHRGNLKRLFEGTERKTYFFGAGPKEPPAEAPAREEDDDDDQNGGDGAAKV